MLVDAAGRYRLNASAFNAETVDALAALDESGS